MNRNQSNDSKIQENFEKIKTDKLSIDMFDLVKCIGHGAYGEVWLAQKKQNNVVFAIKVINKRNVIKSNTIKQILTEKEIMQTVKNPFIVRLRYAFQDKTHLYFVQDYYSGGDLFTLVEKQRYYRFSEDHAKFYISLLLLLFLKINILLCMDGHIILTDFGMSKYILEGEPPSTSMVGTPEYMAPEILTHQGHGKPVDWWAFGILLYQLLVGVLPFDGETSEEIFAKILHKTVVFPPSLSYEARDLLKRLLNKNPDLRLCSRDGAREIMNHSFFKGTNWLSISRREISPPLFNNNNRGNADTMDEVSNSIGTPSTMNNQGQNSDSLDYSTNSMNTVPKGKPPTEQNPPKSGVQNQNIVSVLSTNKYSRSQDVFAQFSPLVEGTEKNTLKTLLSCLFLTWFKYDNEEKTWIYLLRNNRGNILPEGTPIDIHGDLIIRNGHSDISHYNSLKELLNIITDEKYDVNNIYGIIDKCRYNLDIPAILFEGNQCSCKWTIDVIQETTLRVGEGEIQLIYNDDYEIQELNIRGEFSFPTYFKGINDDIGINKERLYMYIYSQIKSLSLPYLYEQDIYSLLKDIDTGMIKKPGEVLNIQQINKNQIRYTFKIIGTQFGPLFGEPDTIPNTNPVLPSSSSSLPQCYISGYIYINYTQTSLVSINGDLYIYKDICVPESHVNLLLDLWKVIENSIPTMPLLSQTDLLTLYNTMVSHIPIPIPSLSFITFICMYMSLILHSFSSRDIAVNYVTAFYYTFKGREETPLQQWFLVRSFICKLIDNLFTTNAGQVKSHFEILFNWIESQLLQIYFKTPILL
ncbi:hypothetical protein WA158_006165 [Blastocystis sp. Blastoise]